jgi:hypothetical protein
MPQWKIEKGGARRVYRLGNIQGAGHTNGGDPFFFGMSGNQSNGLMTDGSNRDEKKNIHCVFK